VLLHQCHTSSSYYRRYCLHHYWRCSRDSLYSRTAPGTFMSSPAQTMTDNHQGLDVNTPYTDFGCASSVDTTATSPVSGGLLNVLSISSCLRACNTRGYRFAYITNLAVSLCRCSSSVEIASPSVCGLGRNYVYVNRNVSPSGVARKRMLDAKKRAVKVGLCPTGLSACQINQGGSALDAFEVSY
jgi:hypothetical protein